MRQIGRRRTTQYAGEEATECPWPPREMLKQMLAEATDLQLAELLDRSREEIRHQRVALNVPSFGRGGSSKEKAERRERFLDTWLPQLQAIGYPIRGASLHGSG